MASNEDLTEFVDSDFQERQSPFTAAGGLPRRAPSREEVDIKVNEAQQKLAELKRAQEDLERQRSELEETRRRQQELHTSRDELVHSLTRGIGLLEEAEFTARQEAEQMAKTLNGLRDSLDKVGAIQEQTWPEDGYQQELTRALTALENARMEWNSARLKFPVLSERPEANDSGVPPGVEGRSSLAGLTTAQALKLGMAFTWPLTVVLLGLIGVLVALLLQG